MKLLTSNAKLSKSEDKYISLGLQLYPYKLELDNKIINSCSNAQKYGCYKTCVAFAGMGSYKNVQNSRIEKTKLFYNDFKTFKKLLELELIQENLKAKKQNKVLTVRLNTYSDINVIKFYKDLINKYNDVVFYDYTKIIEYVYNLKKYHDRNELLNYNIVYSLNIDNINDIDYIKNILNVTSVVIVLPICNNTKNKDFDVFMGKYKYFKGFNIVNGDQQDIRQEKGKIICLSFKGGKNKLQEEIKNNNKIILPINQLKYFS